MSHQDYTEAFSGLYLAPGYYMGSDNEAYRAYLNHLKTLLNPTKVEDYRLIGAWATLQWRLQCLHITERDCWESYELAMAAMNPVGESSMLDMDPFERLAANFKAIRAWDTMVKLDARLKREEARLIPLLEAMLERAEGSDNYVSTHTPQQVAVGKTPDASRVQAHLTTIPTQATGRGGVTQDRGATEGEALDAKQRGFGSRSGAASEGTPSQSLHQDNRLRPVTGEIFR